MGKTTMKTDRELLELAAKAAGIPNYALYDTTGDCGGVETPGWNPRDDDGDALRLAVKVGICVIFFEESDTVCAEHSAHGVVTVEAMDDSGARRAIVRAAAAIGESMP
jgi:hypothetical protein